jgi:hypothetical protein
MGYTHYFRQHRDFTEAEWTALTEYARKIVNAALCEKIELANGDGEAGTDPEITRGQIMLNGVDDDAHETFLLTRRVTESFSFCKTQEKPYDPVVVTILVAANTIAPDAIEISSDGGPEALVPQFTDRVPPPKLVRS